MKIRPNSIYLFPSMKTPSFPLSNRAIDDICKRNIKKMKIRNYETMNFHKLKFSACLYYCCDLGLEVK